MERDGWRRRLGAALLAMMAAAAPARAQAPQMTPADALQLAQAAGFRYVGGELLNVCGKPSAPRFAFIDLNGDGRPEAVVNDKNAACYGPPGDWFAILVRDGAGQWRALLREVGTMRWERTRTRGWLDLRVATACEGIWRYNGRTYVAERDCVPPSEQGRPSAGLALPAERPAPGAPPPTAAPGSLTAADRTAAMRAAGFVQKGGKWTGCDGESTASIEPDGVRDLNGDGQLEIVVTDSGLACYGNTGTGFVLLTRAPSGGWRTVYASPGIPEFLKTSANGWPDLEVGGPGFCFPVLRWNGRTYVRYRQHEYSKGACARR